MSEVLVEISLPVSLEIIVTDQSLEGNEDAVIEPGVVGTKTENASSWEPMVQYPGGSWAGG